MKNNKVTVQTSEEQRMAEYENKVLPRYDEDLKAELDAMRNIHLSLCSTTLNDEFRYCIKLYLGLIASLVKLKQYRRLVAIRPSLPNEEYEDQYLELRMEDEGRSMDKLKLTTSNPSQYSTRPPSTLAQKIQQEYDNLSAKVNKYFTTSPDSVITPEIKMTPIENTLLDAHCKDLEPIKALLDKIYNDVLLTESGLLQSQYKHCVEGYERLEASLTGLTQIEDLTIGDSILVKWEEQYLNLETPCKRLNKRIDDAVKLRNVRALEVIGKELAKVNTTLEEVAYTLSKSYKPLQRNQPWFKHLEGYTKLKTEYKELREEFNLLTTKIKEDVSTTSFPAVTIAEHINVPWGNIHELYTNITYLCDKTPHGYILANRMLAAYGTPTAIAATKGKDTWVVDRYQFSGGTLTISPKAYRKDDHSKGWVLYIDLVDNQN